MNKIFSALEQHAKSRLVLQMLVIGAALFVSLFAWSVSSPVASSPDDDFHLGSIWCADGLNSQKCTTVGKTVDNFKTQVNIPAVGTPCFAGDPNASAVCQQDISLNEIQSSSANTGLYPSSFYKFQSLFITDQGADSVLRMRLANTILFVGLFMLALVLSTRSNRLLLGLMFVLTSVPMGMFIIPSTNPSSWIFIAISVNWAFQVLLLSPSVNISKRNQFLAASAMLLSGFLALESRSDGKIYLLISICITYALIGKQIKFVQPWTHAVPFVLIGTSLFKFFTDSSFSGFGSPGGGKNLDSEQYLFTTLFRAIEIPLGNLGYLAPGGNLGVLGWLDTPIPPMVPFLTIGLLASWTFLLYSSGTWDKRFSFWSISLLLILIPAFLLYSGRNLVGENVQPRYVIPLLPLFVLAAIGVNRGFESTSAIIQKRILFTTVAISIANGLSLLANVNRYTGGSGSFGLEPINREILWWWPNFVPPSLIVVLGIVSYFVFAFLVLSLFSKDESKRITTS
jgi:hypothetical protein